MFDDLLAGAKCLSFEPAEMRPSLAAKLVSEAHAAHQYVKRFGKPHPSWGNGSLMARALAASPLPPQPLCLASLAVIALAVDQFRQANSRQRHGLSS